MYVHDCNKHTNLVGDIDAGGGSAGVGSGGIWEVSTFLSFAVNLTVLQKMVCMSECHLVPLPNTDFLK